MSFFEFLESLSGDWPDGWWIDPDGHIHELNKLQTHWNWMSNNTEFDDIEQAFNAGWARMIASGNDLYVHIENQNINYKQRGALLKFCEKHQFDRMLLDRGNLSRSQTIWQSK